MTCDVIVLGAGVAGAATAALLAEKGQRVALLERKRTDESAAPRPDWIPRPALDILGELKAARGNWLGKPITGAVFHSADLTRRAASEAKEPPALRVDYSQLVRELNSRAAKAGADRLEGAAITAINFGEDRVTVRSDNRDPIDGRFLVAALGTVGSDSAIPALSATGGTAHWVAETCAQAAKAGRDNLMHWVLGMDGGRSLGAWWFDKAGLVIRLHAQGTRGSAVRQLGAFASALRQRGLLPGDLALDEANMTARPAPASTALEMESHVGKRCLYIGDAGGFIAATNREGIHPALWSARLAADVLIRAATSRHPQDELRHFGTLWRSTMADRLRSPSTDAQLILPLIFTNQPMADRMADAFWYGESI